MSSANSSASLDATFYGLWGTYCFTLCTAALVLYFSDFRIAAFSDYLRGREEIRNRPILRYILLVLEGLVLLLPLIFSIAKVIYLGSRSGEFPAVSYFFMQLLFILLLTPIYDSLFYLKMFFALVLLTVGQLVGTFTSPNFSNDSDAFFSVSAIFLTINGILFSVALYIRSNSFWAISQAYEAADSLKQQISSPILQSASLDGGLFYQIAQLSNWLRRVIMVVLYVLSICVLIGYSIILFYETNLRHLGTITSVAVITTDIVILLVIYKEEKSMPFLETLLVFLSRVLLVSFGVNFWFVGYCFSYILISLYISFQLVQKYHFLQNEVPTTQRSMRDMAKTPEFQAIILNIFFGAMNFYLGYGDSPDVPTQVIDIVGQKYQFWVLGAISVVSAVMGFTFIAGIQFYRREKLRLMEVKRYYLLHGAINQLWVYFGICYFCILAITLSLSLLPNPNDWFLFASGIFLPPVVFLFILAYSSWESNNYQILKDIAAYNEEILKDLEMKKVQNKQREEYNKKLQEDIMVELKNKEIEADSIHSLSTLRNREDLYRDEMEEEARVFSEQRDETMDDWREDSNFFSAFIGGKLVRTDYYIILSLFLNTLLLIGYGITVFYQDSGNVQRLIGFNIGLVALLLVVSVRPLHRNYQTLAPLDVFDWISVAVGLVLHVGLGLAYYFVYVDTDPDMKFYLIYLFALPIPFFMIYGLLKLNDDNYQLSIVAVVFMSLGFAFALTDSIWTLAGVNVPAGVAMLCTTIYAMTGFGIYFYYRRNDRQLPYWLKIGLLVGNLVLVLILVIIAFAVSSVNNFWVFSVAFLLLAFGLLVFTLYRLITEEYISEFFLMFYSADWSKIYSYERQKSQPNSQRLTLAGLSLSLFLLLFWTFIAMIFFQPIHLGVSLSAIAELIAFQLMLLLITRTETESYYLAQKTTVQEMHTIQVEAWKKVSKMKMPNVKRYEELLEQLQNIPSDELEEQCLIINQITQRKTKELEMVVYYWLQILLGLSMLETEKMDKLITFIQEAQQELIKYEIRFPSMKGPLSVRQKYAKIEQAINEMPQQKKYYFEKLKVGFADLKKRREEEERMLKLKEEEQSRKRKQQQQRLLQLELERQRKIKQGQEEKRRQKEQKERKRKQQQQEQKRKMQEQQKRFQQEQRRLQEEMKRLAFIAQQEQNEEERRKKEDEEQRIQEEIRQKQEAMRRQREQEERRRLEAEQQRKRAQEEQRRQGNQSNQNKISNMSREEVLRLPASPQKVQALIRLSGPDSLFQDKEITQDQYVGNKFTQVIKGWKRPTDQMTLVIDKDNAALGVKQGYIGDCYLISAIGVLSSHLKQVLGLTHWQNPRGGYLIRLSKFGDPIYVLIDDLFPTYYDHWAFGACQNKGEIYVNVIEKAYAKLFGGYKNIVGGHVHEALSLLTGGIPARLNTSDYKSNPQEFFNIVKDYINKGFLLGASSNPHQDGDRATSPKGIVQGHAYQLISAKEIDSHKLIKLRNPHGNSGQEWTGDWSDNSSTWTKRNLALINDQFKKDGAFWISVQDMIKEFRAISICKLFDPACWKAFPTINSEWHHVSAQGLTGGTPKSDYTKNPQWGIKVERSCNVVVVLQQERNEDEFHIHLMIQKNDGERIKGNYTKLIVASSGPAINSKSVTVESQLSQEGTYSLMACTYQAGQQSTFVVKIFCTDLGAQLVDLK